MALQDVKRYFQEKGLDYEVLEFETSTATVELAAQAVGVEPGMIAKTMSFKLKNNENILVLTAGDKRVDNKKFKAAFQSKGKMLDHDEVMEITGHPVGGVCPFGLKNNIPVYLDISLKKYQYVYPAAGSPNSAVKLTPAELSNITQGKWVDVCNN
ncbi:MAG: YbaK/EbsC family protein [Peptococcaceae bacterium]|jgi:Cys-tRNA(Pro) deacylase|nr:YbaK/EbsC family protein [Peptococcaceae bacterium]